jgi:hypothetical protein
MFLALLRDLAAVASSLPSWHHWMHAPSCAGQPSQSHQIVT